MMPKGYSVDAVDTFLTAAAFDYVVNPLVQNIFAGLLIFIQALIINYIFNQHKLSRESSLFSGVFYVLFVSLIPGASGLTPVLIANTFMLIALMYILNTYKNIQATSQIFNAGFMIAVASFFYIPYAVFILFGIVALLQLRSFKLVEKLQFLTGVITPYFLIFTLKYWYNLPFIEVRFLGDIFFRLPEISMEQPLIEYIAIGVMLLAAMAGVAFYGTVVAKKAVQIKKKIEILYWFMVFCMTAYLIFNTELTEHLLSLAIPVSLLTGILSTESKNKIFFELMHLLLIIIVFAGQFKLINF